jgi:CubicO group peptidase (beta-lactamase class C family)
MSLIATAMGAAIRSVKILTSIHGCLNGRAVRRAHNEHAILPETVTSAIDALAGDAIASRIFPGAVIACQVRDATYVRAYGTSMYADSGSQPIQLDTIFDIASLTKIFTATAALRLADQQLIRLETPVCAYLPTFADRHCQIVHLLTHSSGLDLRLSTLAPHGAAALRSAVYATRASHPPGTQVAYTNINALLLGDVVAAVTGLPLDRALDELVIAPAGLRETGFCPAPALRPRIAPTEHDDTWRTLLLHGVVHDESAYALHGVAGHAGLFSTASDLLQLCEVWLSAWHGRNHTFLRQDTARRACRNHTPAGQLACGLGWMLGRPAFMGQAPASAYGHTGYTGPAIVTVPECDLIVVILSNRVYPRRGPAVHHAVTARLVELALAGARIPQVTAS